MPLSKDSYFQIPIWECYWQFLMFQFEDLQIQSPPLRHYLGPLAIHKVYGHSPGTPMSARYQGLELSRRLIGLCPDRKCMQVTRVCACELSLTLGSFYQYEEKQVGAISNHSVFGSDFRLQKSNCDFNLRDTAGNKSLPLSLSSRGESQLGAVSLPNGSNGSHSAGGATCLFHLGLHPQTPRSTKVMVMQRLWVAFCCWRCGMNMARSSMLGPVYL